MHKYFAWFSEPLRFSAVSRIRFAWVSLIFSIIGFPITWYIWGTGEPVIFFLSWLAITYTALDILFTTDVRVNQENNDEG